MTHFRAIAIALILVSGGMTAASAQPAYRGGPAQEPGFYADSDAGWGRPAVYDNTVGAFGNYECDRNLKHAMNGGRAPSMRYPAPEACLGE